MEITLLKAKIHRAVVTQADLNYVGSVTIDSTLLQESCILQFEKLHIVVINDATPFEIYTIAGEPGSGIICLNGAAAKCVSVGDKVIIMAYANLTPEEAKTHKPMVVFVDDDNKIARKANYEKHGLLCDQ